MAVVVVVIVVVVVKLFLPPTKTNSVDPLFTAVPATCQTCLLPRENQLSLWSVCTSPSYWLQGNIWQGATPNQRPPPHLSLALCFLSARLSVSSLVI
jgi:hypothetical protein